MKQIIEIEVPKGKKVVYENNKIIFEDASYESIKTVDDAINYLKENKLCPNIIDSYNRIPFSAFEYKIISYRAVVAALTHNEERHLTTGYSYFPTIEFCRIDKINNCYGDTIVGRIKSEGEEFDVISGYASNNSYAGLSNFFSLVGVSYAGANVSFRSVGNIEVAKYISKQFGRLLFEVCYGGTNCDWEWISK